MSAADLLAECESAISATMVSQEYRVADRDQRRALLGDLTRFRRELMQEIQGGGQMATLGQVDRPNSGSGTSNIPWCNGFGTY